jgi:hypothetical protein
MSSSDSSFSSTCKKKKEIEMIHLATGKETKRHFKFFFHLPSPPSSPRQQERQQRQHHRQQEQRRQKEQRRAWSCPR